MVPNAEFPPLTPFTFQVTDVFVVLVTVAVNCLVVFTRTLALVGEMLMPTGGGGGGFVTVTAALPTAERHHVAGGVYRHRRWRWRHQRGGINPRN